RLGAGPAGPAAADRAPVTATVATTAAATATMDTSAPIRRRRPGAAPVICVFGRLPMACCSSQLGNGCLAPREARRTRPGLRGPVGPRRGPAAGEPGAGSARAGRVRGWSAGEAARAAGNDPRPSRASRASPARAPPGLRENCSNRAAVAAAATPGAILMISLTVTQFILSRAVGYAA